MQNEIKWHSLSAESTLKKLKSDSEKGLSNAQVTANKKIYGSNALVQKKKKERNS